MREEKRETRRLNNVLATQRLIIRNKNDQVEYERNLQKAASTGLVFLEGQLEKVRNLYGSVKQREISAVISAKQWKTKWTDENRLSEHLKTELISKEQQQQKLAEAVIYGALEPLEVPPNLTYVVCFVCHEYFKENDHAFGFTCSCKYIRLHHKKCMARFLVGYSKWECYQCRQPFGKKLLSSCELARRYNAVKTEPPIDAPSTSTSSSIVCGLPPSHWDIRVQTEDQ